MVKEQRKILYLNPWKTKIRSFKKHKCLAKCSVGVRVILVQNTTPERYQNKILTLATFMSEGVNVQQREI